LHLSDTLPSIFGDDTLGLIIVRIFADLLQFIRCEIVEKVV